MDETLRRDNPNPFLSANPISKIFFSWLNPLFKKGCKGWLEETDMYNTCPSDQSKILGDKIESSWKKELMCKDLGGKPSLLRALVRTFWLEYVLWGLILLVEGGIEVSQPILLAQLLDYFTPDPSTTRTEAWIYATAIVFSSMVLAISHHPYSFSAARMGMRVRIGCCSLMFKKSLRLSNRSLNESSVGQIVNLMSNDVARFDQALMFFHFLAVGPIQALAALGILWHEVGPSVLAGLAVLVLLMPTQIIMGKIFSKLRRKTAIHTDKRVKVMNEIISGMRIIKMYCWEKPFRHLVEKLRSDEVRHLRRTRRIQACVLGPYFATSQLSIFLLFLVFTLTGHEDKMRPSTIFLIMGVIQCVRLTCGLLLPIASQQLAETLAVVKRIEEFLLREELVRISNTHSRNDILRNEESKNADKRHDIGVEMDNVTAKWEGRTSETNTLEDITLKVMPGELLAVIGPVGAGKTSMLMSILGELPLQSGTVKTQGKIAYVSQHPWVFSGSVRQNIVFGAPFDKTRYDKIIKICALSRDLSVLSKGDATLIGDRGVTLSGGQRARVSLARALYMDADIYLLDDPLSAVDTAVGKHIFEKCLIKFLKNKPRILVTHQVQLLPIANKIVILTEGKVATQGTYSELSQSGVDFSELLKLSKEECNKQEQAPTTEKCLDSKPNHNPENLTENDRIDSSISLSSSDKDFELEQVQLPDEEEREIGSIDIKVFMEYFKAGSGFVLFLLMVLFLFLAQFLYVANDWWLARWSNEAEDRHTAQKEYDQFLLNYNITDINNIISMNITLPSVPDVDSYRNLYILGGITLALIGSSLSRALLFFKFAVDASKNLHNQMFARLLRTKIGFFDTNPVGRVLNRFAKDVGQIDDRLPWTMFDFLQNALLTLGIVVVAGIINPWVFIPTVPLAFLFFIFRKYYVQTSRSVKRLEATTRSPVFSYLSASLQGIHTIRAMGMEERCSHEFDDHQDLHTEAWFLFLTTSRWLAVRLDWLSVLFITCVVYSAVLAADTLDVGFVGLSVTYSVYLMGLFQWCVRESAEVENQMISVERIIAYTSLPVEADLESTPDKKPPPSWPTHGSIHAKDVSLQYSPTGPYVLKNLSFDIHAAEKIGIVGRTGAGKSSLITTLFRMVEPQGTLLIDGINIHSIGLHDLRGAISIIPQDPMLFTGPVRRNLDPFQEYSDDQLWRALDEVQLKGAINATSEGLYTEVDEGGSNFSAGQRQLMCLARAVLGNTRMLVIDEATANVDPITDELIQQTIRTKFKECTVLTIAHRLHTIIDSDRIMVLDAGEIVQMDTPMALLCKGEAKAFYAMAEQLGKTEMEHLIKIVRTNQAKALSSQEETSLVNDENRLSTSVLKKADASGISLSETLANDSLGEAKSSDLQLQDKHGYLNNSLISDVTKL